MLGIEDQVVRTTTVAGDTVAYAVVGHGPPVVVGGWWCSHLSLNWRDPLFREYLSRLAARHSIIRYDRPGTGASPPDGAIPLTLDAEVEVMTGIADALSLERFAVVGASSGGATAVAFAASRPKEVTRLVLYGAFARGEDLAPEAARTAMVDVIGAHWGLGSRLLADVFVPGASNEEREAFAAFQRASATREQAAASLAATYELDVTEALAELRLPTTVIHRREDRAVPFALGADVARRIRGARFVALDGVDHFPWRGDSSAVADATLRGLGHRVEVKPDPPGPESVTRREREILELVSAGLTDTEIAERLVISVHTVHRHIANARTKLGVRSRAAAAVTMAQVKQPRP
ncbi:alpha/beta fold hydrolase [Mumia sp. DW29H23]|uniref:alpha/beta fold hydrolase n=1 Tax=Mumia sp. DW29H23 TaxID=3421241 RepID=UPI003D69711A